jgi:siroheme synthase
VLTAGHRASESSDVEWSKFGGSDSTFVVYMPGHDYGEIAERLTAAGFAEETPCAIISRATTPQQKVHRTTISNLQKSPRLAAPTLLVVGEVVRIGDHTADLPEATFPVTDATFATQEERLA